MVAASPWGVWKEAGSPGAGTCRVVRFGAGDGKGGLPRGYTARARRHHLAYPARTPNQQDKDIRAPRTGSPAADRDPSADRVLSFFPCRLSPIFPMGEGEGPKSPGSGGELIAHPKSPGTG